MPHPSAVCVRCKDCGVGWMLLADWNTRATSTIKDESATVPAESAGGSTESVQIGTKLVDEELRDPKTEVARGSLGAPKRDERLQALFDYVSSYEIEQALPAICALERQIEELQTIIRRECEDWAEDDTKMRELCAPIVGQKFVDGDSYAVPDMVTCAEEAIKSLRSQLQIVGDKLQRAEAANKWFAEFIIKKHGGTPDVPAWIQKAVEFGQSSANELLEELERLKKKVTEREAELIALHWKHGVAIGRILRLRQVLKAHHDHESQMGSVYFEQDGKPIEIATDLGEAYQDSQLCSETEAALSATTEVAMKDEKCAPAQTTEILPPQGVAAPLSSSVLYPESACAPRPESAKEEK